MSLPSHHHSKTGCHAWPIETRLVIAVNSDRDGNLIVLPGHVTNGDDTIIAQYGRPNAVRFQRPQTIHDLRRVWYGYDRTPTYGVGQGPDISVHILNRHCLNRCVIELVRGSNDDLIRST